MALPLFIFPLLTTVGSPGNVPTLLAHIAVVVGSRSQKQMRRPDARRVISPRTVVQNTLTAWNRPVMNLPRIPMCSPLYDGPVAWVNKSPIPLVPLAGSPNPTPSGFSNFVPKPTLRFIHDCLQFPEIITRGIRVVNPNHGKGALRVPMMMGSLTMTPRIVRSACVSAYPEATSLRSRRTGTLECSYADPAG